MQARVAWITIGSSPCQWNGYQCEKLPVIDNPADRSRRVAVDAIYERLREAPPKLVTAMLFVPGDRLEAAKIGQSK